MGNSNSENQLLTMGDDAKLEEIQKLGGTAIKPVGWDRTGWEAFQYMLYNPDTGEVLTRTPLSWLKITPKKGSEGQLIHIECRAYYDGVKHITKTKEGMVMFELQIKDE